jgi:hypothetical protein
MFKSLKLVNYRSHADSAFPLQPITLFVGPVSAGKSNILRSLVMIQNSVHYTLVEMFPPGLGEFHWVRSRWAGETDPVGFEVDLQGLEDFPDRTARYKLFIADSPDGLYVLEETLQSQAGDQPWEWVFQRRMRGRPEMGEFGTVTPREPSLLHKVWHRVPDVNYSTPGVVFARAVARHLSRIGYFHLEASELKAVGTGQPVERISYYGGRLADFIGWTKSRDEGVPIYQAILAEMRELLPELDSIIVTRVGTDQQGLAMAFRNQRGYIAAPDLSDGTMLTLGLLSLVHSPRKPAVLCLEEPESGLHPRRMRWIFDRLLRLAYPREGQQPVQVVLTTHSPYLVDLFSDMPESVLITEQQQGRSKVTPLRDLRARLHIDDTGGAIGHEWASGLYEGI